MCREIISDYIDKNKQNIILDIKRIVAVPSVKGEPCQGMPFGENTAKALWEALEICRSHGFEVKNIENAIGYADLNSMPTKLGIFVHSDVVPEGDGWTVPPFEVTEKDNIIYGRGVSDDKGPLISALYAMKAVKELNIPLKKNARLIIGTDEECGSNDLHYYFDNEAVPAYSFSPDAEFPVINTEKGRFAPEFTAHINSSENVAPRIMSFSAGVAVNAVPSEAVIQILGCDVDIIRSIAFEISNTVGVKFDISKENNIVLIKITGKSAHASTPELGINPITLGLELIKRIPLAECKSTGLFRKLTELFPHGNVNGEQFKVNFSDEISGKLTLSLDVLNFDGKKISGYFDCRMPVSSTYGNTVIPITKAFEAFDFTVMSDEFTKPHHVPESSELVQTLLKAYEKYTGKKGECLSMGGGTYVHDIENGVAFGPVSIDTVTNMHGADEQIPIDELLTAAKIYAEAIINICK